MTQQSSPIETMAQPYTQTIVIDAGHGFPDGGATVQDVVEADINLIIAQKLKGILEEQGYDVIMTRVDEKNIADQQQQGTLSQMKASDLSNRVKIINESNADFCISIHLNQYANAKYWGWQTFYHASSQEGKRLATNIQEKIGTVILKENKRKPLTIQGIKIVDQATIPVVIVECGFLSNPEEASLLQQDAYQNQLVEGICRGIEAFYE